MEQHKLEQEEKEKEEEQEEQVEQQKLEEDDELPLHCTFLILHEIVAKYLNYFFSSFFYLFLPTPLAVAWVFTWTFYPSSPSLSHLKILCFSQVQKTLLRGGCVGPLLSMRSCYLTMHYKLNLSFEKDDEMSTHILVAKVLIFVHRQTNNNKKTAITVVRPMQDNLIQEQTRFGDSG